MNKNIIKILIVGAGNIGSSHLEGAVKNKNQLSLVIFDKSEKALDLSKKNISNKKYDNKLTNLIFTTEAPKDINFDICLMCTTADNRANITIDLLNKCHFKKIVFEKVLFQKNIDFQKISNILKKKSIKAWVNCPRRTYSFYKDIKKLINLNSPVEIDVSGSHWGLACNTIHFVDLFSYLVEENKLEIVDKNFSKTITKSNRGENFFELTGSIKFAIEKHFMKISCYDNCDPYLNIKIKNGKTENIVNESAEIWQSYNSGLKNIKKIKIPYQSNETEFLIDDILNDKCGLVSYENSCKHHIFLLNVIREHMSKILNKKLIECPIT